MKTDRQHEGNATLIPTSEDRDPGRAARKWPKRQAGEELLRQILSILGGIACAKQAGIERLSLLTACSLAFGLAQASRGQTIVDPGVIDPGSTYAGKTYSRWSAAWWQYLMRLPTTNNPLLFDPAHPVIPMRTGQSGPVWFIGGDFGGKGPRTQCHTNTIPGDIALFLGIESFEWDNADCSAPDSATEAEMLADIRPEEDRVTNIDIITGPPSLTFSADSQTGKVVLRWAQRYLGGGLPFF